MPGQQIKETKQLHTEEKKAPSIKGMPVLILNILLSVAAVAGFIISLIRLSEKVGHPGAWIALIVVCVIYIFLICPLLFIGLKILKPNEALVLTLFGKYYGTLRGEGFFFVNPFVSATSPEILATSTGTVTTSDSAPQSGKLSLQGLNLPVRASKKISLKTMTLNNEKQKINDKLGNPIIIGIVVIWRVVNTAKAVFNVDNYFDYLSIQCDSALRNIVRLYPYDVSGDDNEKTLRGSSQEIADKLREEIQSKVEVAGLEILEARITHLAYAPEIAAAMLQRQQASAIIDARQMIVEGAVGMVEMALSKLNEHEIVQLDEERKAAMVSNLLVVLCGNKDAQPVVNSGSLY
jgi:regulator of protease activity HflC (stomatin/prohibitin superfamily)